MYKHPSINYQPQHPMFRQSGQSKQPISRRVKCYLRDNGTKKQQALITEYWSTGTTEKRKEAIINNLIQIAKCFDGCKFGCTSDEDMRNLVIKKIQGLKEKYSS
jgi:hypothetical protein